MPPSLPVLVVEDNDALRQATVEMLDRHGFAAVGVPCAEDVDDLTLPNSPRLFVIDLNLPDEDGISLARRLRRANPKAGILITSARVQLHERLQGYDAGADIYLPKPVAPTELLAALNALKARLLSPDAQDRRLVLERDTRQLRGPSGSVVLSESEARLLTAFTTARERTLERWQVGVQLNPSGEAISADSLQNRVSMLRKKLAACGAEGEVIAAIRTSGYRLATDVALE